MVCLADSWRAAETYTIGLPLKMVQAEGGGKIMQNRSLFLGVGIGLFDTLAVLTARYVAIVLAG